MTPLNTRIAPSPTGDMHLGTARTAYFNWLAARASGGRFILRIDDTDQARNRQECVDDILRVMDWLGLDYDEVYYQSHHLDDYRHVAENMVRLSQARRDDNGAILFTPFTTLPAELPFWTDEVAGEISVGEQDWDYIAGMPLIRGDGTPTYNFATVVDEIWTKVNFVIRGTDHVKNTAKQMALFQTIGLGGELPRFAHLGLLFQDKKKLSKRNGIGSMIGLMESGYDPDAVLNFLLRLGWGPTIDDKTTALLPRERALELFLEGGKMKNSPANVDPAKLDSFDRKYKARRG